MNSKVAIKQVIAGLMLLLFAFSITPKKQLHVLVANHQDTKPIRYLLAKEVSQVHKTGIYCHCDQIIVESPFLCATARVDFTYVGFHNEFYQKPFCFSFVAPLVKIGLRGPPTI